jgi:excisionase family DNA binding protein
MVGPPDLGRESVPPDAPLLIAAGELATILSVSTRTVWRLLSAGKLIQPVRIGSAVRWRYDEVCDWVRAGCPTPCDLSSVGR